MPHVYRVRQQSQGEELDTYVSECLKASFCFFIFCMWLNGLFLIGVGIWCTPEKEIYSNTESTGWILLLIAIGIIIVGCIMFLLPPLGFVGVIQENITSLRVFSAFAGLTVIIEIVLTVLAFLYWDHLTIFQVVLEEAVVRYRENRDLMYIMDSLQEQLRCCGAGPSSFRDWSLNAYFNCSSSNPSVFKCGVPYSCCTETSKRLVNNVIEQYKCGFQTQQMTALAASSLIYTKGCVEAIADILKKEKYFIVGILIGTAVWQFISLVMAGHMISRIKKFCKDFAEQRIKRRIRRNNFRGR